MPATGFSLESFIAGVAHSYSYRSHSLAASAMARRDSRKSQ